MRITLIQPTMGRRARESVKTWKIESLTAATLAGITPPRHEVVFYDDRVEPIPYDEHTDLVGITAETYNARRTYQIAAEYRRRGVPVVVGGYHPTLLPGEVAAHADAVVVGEAEPIWERLLADAAAGALEPLYRAERRPDLVGLRPRRDVLAGKRYLKVPLVEASRGCPHGCEFCSVSAFFDRTAVHRPPKEVAREIDALGSTFVHLVDDNVAPSPAQAKRLLRELVPLGIKWVGQAPLTIARDPELLDLFEKSGCIALLLGLESLSKRNLDVMKKPFDLISGGQTEALDAIRERGIRVYASLVLGYDDDGPDAFDRTLEFALEQKFFFCAFNHLQPFPGTPVYERLRAEGRLLYDRWWLDPKVSFGDIVYRPARMSAEELRERVMDVRKRFYGVSGILRRATDLAANLASPMSGLYYFLGNVMMSQDFGAKWGKPFGDLGAPEPPPSPAAEEP